MIDPMAEYFLDDYSYNGWKKQFDYEYVQTSQAVLKTFDPGDEIKFGNNGGKPIRWRILKVIDRSALIISNENICNKPFNQLQDWLNTDFLNEHFTPDDINKIVPYSQENNKVFVLSISEAEELFEDDKERSNGSWWWLRSPGTSSGSAAIVSNTGRINADGVLMYSNNGVRPALWLNLDAGISRAKETGAAVKISSLNTGSLLKSAEDLISEGLFAKAMSKCFTVLDSDPQNGKAYYYMLMADLECRTKEDLADQLEPFDDNQFYVKAMQYGDSSIKDKLAGYINAINARKDKSLEGVNAGDEIAFGILDKTPIRWKVLAVKEDSALIICVNNICNKPFHQDGGSISWHSCYLRKWLNSVFLIKCFTQNDLIRIIPWKLNDLTTDKVFLLSIDEANTLFADDNARSNGSWWWLRSPGSKPEEAAFVNNNGKIFADGHFVDINYGVRPAMWVRIGI